MFDSLNSLDLDFRLWGFMMHFRLAKMATAVRLAPKIVCQWSFENCIWLNPKSFHSQTCHRCAKTQPNALAIASFFYVLVWCERHTQKNDKKKKWKNRNICEWNTKEMKNEHQHFGIVFFVFRIHNLERKKTFVLNKNDTVQGRKTTRNTYLPRTDW